VSGPKSRPRRRLSREARREEILAAALKAFARGGYHGTQVDDVIREAGIARGTFYLHFESKHDVFAALVDRMLKVFLDARPEEPEPPIRTRRDAEQVLSMSYRAVLLAFRRHRLLCRLLLEEAVGADKGFARVLERHEKAWHEKVRSTLATLRERGIARRDLDLGLAATFVVGMVERVTRRHLLGDDEPDIDAIVAALVRFELDGVTG